MNDLDVVIDQWIQPAGRVDHDAVIAAMEGELARLLDEGAVRSPAEGSLDLARLRIDGALVSTDRLAGAGPLGVALARAVAAGLSRRDRP